MSISPTFAASLQAPATSADGADRELRAKFTEATAGLFYGELLKSLRSGVGKAAYIHGGQAEEMFQAQLDQQIVQGLASKKGGGFVEELYQQFRTQLGLEAEASAVQSVQPAEFQQLAELSKAVQQAQPVAKDTQGAFGTEGLTGLLRK